MEKVTQIKLLQPPNQLMSGFLDFAKEVNQKCIDKGSKFTEEELVEIFNNSFSGQTRAKFFLWIGDLNKITEAINIILTDLSDLRRDKNCLKGNPVIRSEFLLQAFFGEFFKIRETSKIFFKYLNQVEVFNKKTKEDFVEFYFTAFNWVYDLRNNFIHQGLSFKTDNVEVDFSFIKNLSEAEKDKFITLITESNTRENTVEIQCALYMEIIIGIMGNYTNFQELLNNVIADLIISFEKSNQTITITKNT